MAIHFSWDVSNVSDVGCMFLHALEFDQDISSRRAQNANRLNFMFVGANKFNQNQLEKWQISEHADTENMCKRDQQPEEEEKQQ